MTNINSPCGLKVNDTLTSALFIGKAHRYIIPSTDASSLYLYDAVKMNGNSNADGIPYITKANSSDACIGTVIGIRNIFTDEQYNYRKPNAELFVYVIDDPYAEFEAQANGILLSTHIGSNANLIISNGNNFIGISNTQVDLTTITTGSAQVKILGIIEREGNELGLYSKIRVMFFRHQLKAEPVAGDTDWNYNLISNTLTPKESGANVHIEGKLTVDGILDPIAVTVSPQATPPITDNGTYYYNSSTNKFNFRENGEWVTYLTHAGSNFWRRSHDYGIYSALWPMYEDNLDFSASIGYIHAPIGTTAERPPGYNGRFRYNNTVHKFEFYENGSWVNYSVGTAANVIDRVADGVGFKLIQHTPTDNLDFSTTTGYFRAPVGTTAERPSALNGMWRYNSTTNKNEFYENGVWVNYNTDGSTTSVFDRVVEGAGYKIQQHNSADNLNLSSATGYLSLPAGTTSERPGSPINGMHRYNTTTGKHEFFESGTWVNYSTGSTPTVNQVPNLLIAGDFSTNPWKRGINFTNTTAIDNRPFQYHADMWMTLADERINPHITCSNSFASQLDLETYTGWKVATAFGGAAISGGMLDLAHDDTRYVYYNAFANADSQQFGRMQYTIITNYNGAPGTTQYFPSVTRAQNDSRNLIAVAHLGAGIHSGELVVEIRDSVGAVITSTSLGGWNPTAGTEYAMELYWDITNGNTWLKINGVKFGSTITDTGTRDANIGVLLIGTDYTFFASSNYSLKIFKGCAQDGVSDNVIEISRGVNTEGSQVTMIQKIVAANTKFGTCQLVRSALTVDQISQTRISAAARVFGDGITKINMGIIYCAHTPAALDDVSSPCDYLNDDGNSPILINDWQFIASDQFTLNVSDYTDIKLENIDISSVVAVNGNWGIIIWYDDISQLTIGKEVEYRHVVLNWGSQAIDFHSENPDIVKVQCKQYYDNSYAFGIIPDSVGTNHSGELRSWKPDTMGLSVDRSSLQLNFDVWGVTTTHTYSNDYPIVRIYSPVVGAPSLDNKVWVIDAAHPVGGAILVNSFSGLTNKTVQLNYAAGLTYVRQEFAHWSVEANLGV